MTSSGFGSEVYIFPLSSAQRSLWFIDQVTPGTSLYNLHVGTRFASAINASALERSLNEIVRRHESLRTAFRSVNGEPMQVITPQLNVKLGWTDLSHLTEAGPLDRALEIADEQAHTPFDLTQWPLLRAQLLKLNNEDFVFLLTVHHIVCDFWSLQLFQKELATLYEASSTGQASVLPDLPIQYADYADWESRWIDGPMGRRALEYWKQQLDGITPLRLPGDRPAPEIPSFAGGEFNFELSAAVYAELVRLSQEERVTLFMATLAAFQTLLNRYTDLDDIVIGTPVANRHHPNVEHLIGFFVNSLVLRTDLSGNPTFREVLQRVKQVALNAYAHAGFPFERLVSELRPERNLSHNPLFDIHFQLLSDPPSERGWGMLSGEPFNVGVDMAKFDLAVDLWDASDTLWGHFEYNADLFSDETIARMVGHFKTLLEQVVADPDRPIGHLPLLAKDEHQQLVLDWNATRVDYPSHTCLHELFEAQVDRTPDATALIFRDQVLTYFDLNRRANQLADYLKSKGIGPEAIVGVYAERSVEMIVGILGILKAGAAYLPLNPADPPERLRFILDDAQPRAVLTQAALLASLPSLTELSLCLDTDWPLVAGHRADNVRSGVNPGNLAYAIYTSGSTGTPRGVLVEGRAVCNHLWWMQSALPLGPDDRIIQKYPFSFDASVCEIFGPLLAGAVLIISEPENRWNISHFIELLRKHEVTVLDVLPSMLGALLADPDFAGCNSLRRVICGGEALPPQLRDDFFRECNAELYNIYGPTEATIGATYARCLPRDAGTGMTIGRPIANTQIYIVDSHMHLVPVGVPGELCIGGAGLARGYLNEPDLTAERFVRNPFTANEGARMYRTGDLARYRADGNIEYLGRLDRQVKLGGYRVELGEIENVLARHPGVQACVVEAPDAERGRRDLVAYVVPSDEDPELWPSLGEYDVYDALLYHAMTTDTRRNEAYRAAISRVAKNKVVLDIGAGAEAILARLCVEAGAARVYAVEIGDEAFEQADRLLRVQGMRDTITLIRGDSTTVRLPEQVDVCVSELLGAIGSSEGVISILNDARRFLKPNGRVIPSRCITRFAPASLPESLSREPRFGVLARSYVEKVFEQVGQPFDLRLCIKGFPAKHLLAEPRDFEDLDFSGVLASDSHNEVEFEISRASVLQGFVLWLNLYPDDYELLDSLHTGLNWLPVFLPVFYPGIPVDAGDVLRVHCQRLVSDARKPDYVLRGSLISKNGQPRTFSYESPYRSTHFRGDPFYEAVFNAREPLPRSAAHVQALMPDLRRFLRTYLPHYAIPRDFVVLDTLPLTAAGKVDRKRLSSESRTRGRQELAYEPPGSELEVLISRVWAEVLGIDHVGTHENFFDLGGDSLLITHVRNRLESALRTEVSVIDLFRYSTVSALAQFLGEGGLPDTGRLDSAEDRGRKQLQAVSTARRWRAQAIVESMNE